MWIFEYFPIFNTHFNSVCTGHRQMLLFSMFSWSAGRGTQFHKDSISGEVKRFRSIVWGWSTFLFDHMVGWRVCGGELSHKPRVSKMINTREKERDVFLAYLWCVKVTGRGPASLCLAVNVRLSRMQEDGALNVRKNIRIQKETRDNPVTQWKEHGESEKVKEKRELAS